MSRSRWLLPLLLVALSAFTRAEDQPRASGPVAHLLGGGAVRGDCLAGLEVMGLSAAARARTVSCRDGDAACDHDHLVNGRCEFWTRICPWSVGTAPDAGTS